MSNQVQPRRDYLTVIIEITKSIVIPLSVALSAYYVQKTLAQQQVTVQQDIATRQDAAAKLALAMNVMTNSRSDPRLKSWAIQELAEIIQVNLGRTAVPVNPAGGRQIVSKTMNLRSANAASMSAGCTDLNSCMKLYFDELQKTEGALGSPGNLPENDRLDIGRYALPGR